MIFKATSILEDHVARKGGQGRVATTTVSVSLYYMYFLNFLIFGVVGGGQAVMIGEKPGDYFVLKRYTHHLSWSKVIVDFTDTEFLDRIVF